jgi:hypothetical protein
VVGIKGVQEGTEKAPMWAPFFEDQCGGDVAYLHHLVRNSRTQLQRKVFSPRAVSVVNIEGTMVLKAEL